MESKRRPRNKLYHVKELHKNSRYKIINGNIPAKGLKNEKRIYKKDKQGYIAKQASVKAEVETKNYNPKQADRKPLPHNPSGSEENRP